MAAFTVALQPLSSLRPLRCAWQHTLSRPSSSLARRKPAPPHAAASPPQPWQSPRRATSRAAPSSASASSSSGARTTRRRLVYGTSRRLTPQGGPRATTVVGLPRRRCLPRSLVVTIRGRLRLLGCCRRTGGETGARPPVQAHTPLFVRRRGRQHSPALSVMCWTSSRK